VVPKKTPPKETYPAVIKTPPKRNNRADTGPDVLTRRHLLFWWYPASSENCAVPCTSLAGLRWNALCFCTRVWGGRPSRPPSLPSMISLPPFLPLCSQRRAERERARSGSQVPRQQLRICDMRSAGAYK
jgi:hypothetical protein